MNLNGLKDISVFCNFAKVQVALYLSAQSRDHSFRAGRRITLYLLKPQDVFIIYTSLNSRG